MQNLDQVETLLKKVLSQAEGVGRKLSSDFSSGGKSNLESGQEAESSNGAHLSNEDLEKVQKLQAELKAKQEEIEKLKADIQSKGASAEPPTDLLEKISELEARLAEYEIIEDDIADLSKYKDENLKLKEQIAKLQSGESLFEDVDLAEDGLVEGEDSKEKSLTSANDEMSSEEASTQEEPSGAGGDSITDDLISEFEQAVNEQLGRPSTEEASSGSVSTLEVGQEVEIVDPDNSSVGTNQEVVDTQAEVDTLFEKAAAEDADDIFGEFVPDEEVLTKEVNTDKMLEEMSNLASLDSDGSVNLDEEFDVDKMAKEAQTLGEKGSS